ncbi:hypothetical protein J2Z48_001843 [Croceifilum oryzae]|uniref:DUF309 domain-containing protein n=1 Tax=Croceifilum oryzae TaxID=1553429 RepID=A0AAJ1WSG0_9BACL|nr:DUF309 domain-containing protein [Croceifilum oryzae]MDQ0417670.1 hypothetical protein [Croceifilum oryzae]
MSFDPLYLRFFDLYHAKEYWEAHEALEDLWQTERSNDFYHGLIQIAAIHHQLERGKVRGVRKLATSALRYLTPYAPECDRVQITCILQWLQFCLDRLPDDIQQIPVEDMAQFAIPICSLPTSKELQETEIR